jgi:protein-L-isoaspartate(D-aspartate) O-methyltransferase
MLQFACSGVQFCCFRHCSRLQDEGPGKPLGCRCSARLVAMDGAENPGQSNIFAAARSIMVEQQIRQRGISDERVLRAMGSVPRHEFVPEEWKSRAYEDEPLPIGEGQTISQPYIVALMVAALRLSATERVLEIGTGCGYQAAVLSCLANEVFTVEMHPSLASGAETRLRSHGYANVRVYAGDGTLGWAAHAPFDAVIVAAAAPEIPSPLIEQLKEGGRLVAPVGSELQQELVIGVKTNGRLQTQRAGSCRFVPLRGLHGWKRVEAG